MIRALSSLILSFTGLAHPVDHTDRMAHELHHLTNHKFQHRDLELKTALRDLTLEKYEITKLWLDQHKTKLEFKYFFEIREVVDTIKRYTSEELKLTFSWLSQIKVLEKISCPSDFSSILNSGIYLNQESRSVILQWFDRTNCLHLVRRYSDFRKISSILVDLPPTKLISKTDWAIANKLFEDTSENTNLLTVLEFIRTNEEDTLLWIQDSGFLQKLDSLDKKIKFFNSLNYWDPTKLKFVIDWINTNNLIRIIEDIDDVSTLLYHLKTFDLGVFDHGLFPEKAEYYIFYVILLRIFPEIDNLKKALFNLVKIYPNLSYAIFFSFLRLFGNDHPYTKEFYVRAITART